MMAEIERDIATGDDVAAARLRKALRQAAGAPARMRLA